MTTPVRQFKFSGMVAPQNALHQVSRGALGVAPDEHYLAPVTIDQTITNPPPTIMIGIPQYSATVYGGTSGYNPSEDCDGNFMSYKFQPNNNCYAYGCNIAPNTFPQPGRANGNLITAATLTGPAICGFAEQDGLVYAGKTIAEVRTFAQNRKAATLPGALGTGALGGHFVALMISPPSDGNWPGDYHWARCDDNIDFNSWSQKDGGDQVTNFDFAGKKITDPATANWTVNQGPMQPATGVDGDDDMVVSYGFYCFMFVPDVGVNIV